MFLHFAYDWAGFMMSGRLVGGTASDAVGMVKDQNVGGVLYFAALCLVATLIILRPKNLNHCWKNKKVLVILLMPCSRGLK